jgi:signal transduction histidine kinase
MRVGRPLVGRRKELDALGAALDGAINGRGSVCLVSGEPGIGKSRLCEELSLAAADKGATVAWGRSWEAGGAPAFWPWVEILRAVFEPLDAKTLRSALGAGASDIVQLIPELANTLEIASPAPLAPVAERFRLFDAVANALVRVSSRSPLLLFFEDLHAADPQTLLLLAFVAPRLQRSRIEIVGTFREMEARLSPDVSDPLAKLARNARTYPLQRLDKEQVAELVASSASIGGSDPLVDRVFRATEGNPLFVDEVLCLVELDAGSARDASELPIPDGVRGAIREHLLRLSEQARATLEVGAVSGRRFSQSVVSAVSGQAADDVRRHLAEAVRLGLIAESAVGRFTFSHVLVRDVLDQELSEDHRAELHRAVADVLEKQHANDPDAPLTEIAHHLSLAGPQSAARALEVLVAASRTAANKLAYEDAAALLEKALSFLELVAPADALRRFDLLLELGSARIRANRGDAGKEACLEAARIARRLGSAELLARAALELGNRFTFAKIDRTLVELLEESLAKLPSEDSALRARTLARLGAALQPAEVPDVPIRMVLDAVEMARRVGDRPALLAALNSAGSAIADMYDAEERLKIDSEMLTLALELGEKALALRARQRIVWDRMELADVAGADVEIRALEALASEFRQPHVMWPVHMFHAMRALFDGRLADADAELSRARALAERGEDRSANLYMNIHLALRDWMLDESERGLELGRGMIAELGSWPQPLIVYAMAAFAEMRAGNLERARELIAKVPIGSPLVAANTDGFSAHAELCWKLGDRARAAAAYDSFVHESKRLLIWGMAGFVCEGPVDRALMLMAMTLDRWDVAERHFQTARELAIKLGAKIALARLEIEYAEGLAAHGETKRASELAASGMKRARELGIDRLAKRAETLANAVPKEVTFGNGRYIVQGRLGQGGQKTVYLVRDKWLNRSCALAWLTTEELSEQAVQRLRNEAQALARMGTHPHVVTIFDIGEEHGRPFVVSEHVPGGDLASELAKSGGALPVARALQIARELLLGLAAIHARGIIHRDIKPSNVWLDASGRAKIGDFGLALTADRERITVASVVNATAEYASPEQLQNETLDGRADLYSVGCVLYELLTGAPPFSGPLVALISQHIHATPKPPSSRKPDLPAEVDAFVLELLAKARESRPADAQAALTGLDALERRISDVGVDLAGLSERMQAEKLASLGDFVAGIAHEMNTPLGALQANVDVLQRAFGILKQALDDEETGELLRRNTRVARAIETLQRVQGVTPEATHRIARIVRDLRNFARLDQAEEESFDVRDGLEHTLAMLGQEPRIAIVKNYGAIPKLRCKPLQLNQAFFNLLMNAVQAIPAQGTITISTAQEGAEIAVRIADTGTGIAREHLARIFDPGFTTKGVGVGVGLGLPIVHRIIDGHGGKIDVDSELGKGTTVTVRLPIRG